MRNTTNTVIAADVAPTADRKLEREATPFAAELVIPEPAVQAECPGAASAAELATRFGVSEEAMGRRIYNFGPTAQRPT
jgi:Zn-dependent peptidase ImmA (M78 family)